MPSGIRSGPSPPPLWEILRSPKIRYTSNRARLRRSYLSILHGKTTEAHSYIGIGCLSVGFRKIVTIYDSNKRPVLLERLRISQIPLIYLYYNKYTLYPLEERWILQFPFHSRLSQATCARCEIWVFYDCHKRHLSLGKAHIVAQFNSIYDCQKQPVSVEESSNFTHFRSFMIVTSGLYPSEKTGFRTISFHLRLSHTARVRGKMSYYVHFVHVTVVVLLGGLCPSENHWVSHTLTLSLLI